MNYLVLKYYNNLIFNQYRLKCLVINTHKLNLLKKIQLSLNLKSIISFKIKEVIEALFYFRLLTNKKAYISYYKKKYKECDLMLTLDLIKNNTQYLLFLWIIYYFPILNRREVYFKKAINSGSDIVFSCNLYNVYPYISDVYFSWGYKIVYTLIFAENNSFKNYLLLSYYNFPMK